MEKRTDKREPPAKSRLVPFLALDSGGNGNGGGYCIPCAVSCPGFRERAPSACSTPFDEEQPRAWIEGRAYSLRRFIAPAVHCVCCGDEAPVVYCRDDTDTEAA